MNKPTYKKILEHPDKDEIISKLVIGSAPSDIHEWLKIKYTNVSETKFVLSEKMLNSFKNTYLDFYQDIQADMAKTKQALATNTMDEAKLAVQGNSTYKDIMINYVQGELDVDQLMAKMITTVETRFGQLYDLVQEDPRNVNTKVERLWNDMTETLGGLIEKYAKMREAQNGQTITHNVTLQVVDQHISVFHDVIKEVLSQMDLETSLYFMEVFNEKFAKLKLPEPSAPVPTEKKLEEAKVLNETINKKINEK